MAQANAYRQVVEIRSRLHTVQSAINNHSL